MYLSVKEVHQKGKEYSPEKILTLVAEEVAECFDKGMTRMTKVQAATHPGKLTCRLTNVKKTVATLPAAKRHPFMLANPWVSSSRKRGDREIC